MAIKEADRKNVARARAHFDTYAAMDAPDLPEPIPATGEMSALQVRLFRWQSRNFGVPSRFQILAGVMEEVGELSHALLKNAQGIRGMSDDDARVAAGDAIADAVVYLIQLCTALRIDFGVLIWRVAETVLGRDWVADPEKGGQE